MARRRATIHELESVISHGRTLHHGRATVQEASGDVVDIRFSRWAGEAAWVVDELHQGGEPVIQHQRGARNTPTKYVLSGWVLDAVERHGVA